MFHGGLRSYDGGGWLNEKRVMFGLLCPLTSCEGGNHTLNPWSEEDERKIGRPQQNSWLVAPNYEQVRGKVAT